MSLQVVGIMVKRGSVEDQGEDRGRLLTEVEQLVSSGDNTMVRSEAVHFLCPWRPLELVFTIHRSSVYIILDIGTI